MRPAAPLTGSGVADAVAVCAAVTAPAAHFPDGARHARSVPPTPAPDARLGVRPGWVTGDGAGLAGIGLPASGCGQVLGCDRAGRAVAARLHGPGVRTVGAAVDDGVALTLVERAVATGASVLLFTARPGVWAPLVRAADTPAALWVAGWRYPPQPSLSALRPTDYCLVVLDGVDSGPAAPTVWRLAPAGAPVTGDVTVAADHPGVLTVRAAGSVAAVRPVPTPLV
ncbi:hypothetical protein [Tsukamurella soli]|uniref:hypothetical protein n=1 Tax=Tsukamurella soli TaxID=644556 RepID=UPI00361B3325